MTLNKEQLYLFFKNKILNFIPILVKEKSLSLILQKFEIFLNDLKIEFINYKLLEFDNLNLHNEILELLDSILYTIKEDIQQNINKETINYSINQMNFFQKTKIKHYFSKDQIKSSFEFHEQIVIEFNYFLNYCLKLICN